MCGRVTFNFRVPAQNCVFIDALISIVFELYWGTGVGTPDCQAFMPIPLDTYISIVYYCIIDGKQCIKCAGAHISYLLPSNGERKTKEEKSEFQPFHLAVYRNRICTATATCANSLTRVSSVWIWCALLLVFGFDVWCVVLATETKFATARVMV